MATETFTLEEVDFGTRGSDLNFRARCITPVGGERVAYASVDRHVYEHHAEAFRVAMLDLAATMAKDYEQITGTPPPEREFSDAVQKVLAIRDVEMRAKEARRLPIWDRLAEAINEGMANMERRRGQ